MPVTVLGPNLPSVPARPATPIVQLKKDWSDEWVLAPDVEVVRATLTVAGHDLSRCELERRYGAVKRPYESAPSGAIPTQAARDLTDYWVRARFATEQGITTEWVGRIANLVTEPYNATSDLSGRQHWVAYGPLNILRKIHVAESWWNQPGSGAVRLGWVPDINGRDERKMLVGNRTSVTAGGTYIYGGTDIWTRKQYIEYILNYFVDEDTSGGPTWTLGGQVDLLDIGDDTFSMRSTQTVAEILGMLISPRLGIDYMILPTDTGFQVFVFALQHEDFSFRGHTLPKNPNTVQLKIADRYDAPRLRVERSSDQRYGRIRVLGKRIVTVCSLRVSDGSLVKGWGSALEAEYLAGDPADPAALGDVHDEYRKRDRFRPVFQLFVAPDDWDRLGGTATPSLDEAGELIQPQPVTLPPRQDLQRRTLNWLPLREGYDYGLFDPADNNDSGVEADFMPPQAWIWDAENERYVGVDQIGIGVQVPQNEFGVFLSATPNHRLALNHFGAANLTEKEPEFDYDTLVATIAFETDQRLVLSHEVQGGASPSDGQIDIATDGEFWHMAPNTAFDVNADGSLRVGSQTLRNDADRLMAIMAGAIARYFNDRARADLTFKGVIPWSGLLGQVLTVVDQGGELHSIKGVITAIDWIMPRDSNSGQTIIHAGYAR